MQKIMKVVWQSDTTMVPSKKNESGQTAKSLLQVKADDMELVGAMFGNLAQCQFTAGQWVAVSFRVSVNEADGRKYHDVVFWDVQPLTYR